MCVCGSGSLVGSGGIYKGGKEGIGIQRVMIMWVGFGSGILGERGGTGYSAFLTLYSSAYLA